MGSMGVRKHRNTGRARAKVKLAWILASTSRDCFERHVFSVFSATLVSETNGREMIYLLLEFFILTSEALASDLWYFLFLSPTSH